MSTLFRYTYKTAAFMVLSAILFTSVSTSVSKTGMTARDLPRIQSDRQALHALELFSRSGFSYLFKEDLSDLRPFVLETIESSLPFQFKDRSFEIARSVIIEANHHGLDPLFLLAVIKTESQFNIKARGSHGEIGLMQILPSTGKWLAPQAGVPENFDLEDPAINIRIGATMFAQLRRDFNGLTQRYVGAYNMGAGNVRRLLASSIEPKEYPSRVLSNYKDFYKNLSRAVVAALAYNPGRAPAAGEQPVRIVSFSAVDYAE